MSMLLYLIKVCLATMAFFLLYKLVFRRLTFFVYNRFYLLGSLFLSITLPLIRIPAGTMEDHLFSVPQMIPWDQFAAMAPAVSPDVATTGSSMQLLRWMLAVYFLIAVIRFCLVIVKFTRIRKTFSGGTLVMQKGIRWYIHPLVKSPFTLFRTVYLDPGLFRQTTSPVRRHEEVHARQLHSIDLLVTEILGAFLWFNPFVFLFRRQIRENHEFLADHVAQSNSVGLVRYMQAFSAELNRNYDPTFASHFRSSTIKNRIIMLTNKRSQKNKKLYYIAALPVIAIFLLAFRQPADRMLPEHAGLSVGSATTSHVPVNSDPGIPSFFPLDERYRNGVTFAYDQHAKHPITGEMMTHRGIDFRAPTGAHVYAAANGTVVKSEEHEKYGKFILIDHGTSYVTLYAHLDELQVTAGEIVTMGRQIGTVGNTGVSTGPHLHYEVRKNGDHVNPADYY